MIASFLEDTLTDLGCEVIGPALNLEDALRLAREAVIDCAGLDVNLAGAAFTLGSLIFSASLYGYVLTDLPKLAWGAPFGGGLFLVGWICLAFAVVQDPGSAPSAPVAR